MTSTNTDPALGRESAIPIERAARQVLTDGPGRHMSAFTPDSAIWTVEHADELRRLFVDSPDLTGLSFAEKLKPQLSAASDSARQLFAELFYLNLLPLADYRPATKRSLINNVLQLMATPVAISSDLDEALEGGVFNGGVAFKTHRYEQLCLLIEFAHSFLSLPADEQRTALDDPIAFRDLLDTITRFNQPAQRHSLAYLAHPQFFMPTVSDAHRRQIRDAFIDQVESPSDDLDRDLNEIRRALGNVDLYQSPWSEKWKPTKSPRDSRAASEPADSASALPSAASSAADDDDPLIIDATPELAAHLNLDETYLQEWIELLRDRPQLIFYGPPGTGKTYLAQELAKHIAGDNVTIVQFHPSTSYEDFFEGYRPTGSTGGSVQFQLKDGPLRKVARAAADPEQQDAPHVLIIDEINRGNLPRIFGELYYLLEYRDRAVDLLYARDDDDKFTLPPNVILMGTMNTSDRSIALVDAAMRRRFAFVPLRPSSPPVVDVLRTWLAKRYPDQVAVADLLDALNSRIDDPEFRIGPSYFMRPAVYQPGGIERMWRTSILPLLEEHHYGQDLDIEARYGYQAIRANVVITDDERQHS